jgi:hypothetical protein
MRNWLCSAILLISATLWGRCATMEDVKARLVSPFHQGLYSRTYRSLLDRVEPSGYFQESLTGAYAGMFPRTVGGLCSLFLETGETERCQALIGHVLKSIEMNGMERVPHVLDRLVNSPEPVVTSPAMGQSLHPIALYRLDQPDRFGGAQEFTASAKPIKALEIWLTGNQCSGKVVLEVGETLTSPALARAEYDAANLSAGGTWARFEFAVAPKLPPGVHYFARAHFSGEGVPAWWGLDNSPNAPLGAGHGRDTTIKPGWLDNPGHVTAFVIDTGDLKHVTRETLAVLDDRDQIDGQAHVLMSWARLALRRGPTPFEDRTYPLVAKLMDRSTDWPYLTPYNPGVPIVLCEMGLVRNVCFEHSREGRFWDTYDLLTQSFVCAALRDMIRVAERRGDSAHAGRWQGRLTSLERAVRDRLTRRLDGQTVYLEMRLPNGGGGVPFEGLGWVNLAPIAAQWEGVDRDILRNTIAALRERATFEWNGKQALATDWWPDRPLEKTVIGKGVGWEMVYSLREGDPDRICQLLDLVEAINNTPLYMESAGLWGDGQWHVGDPGNGEQCSWWCWGMARVRRAAGLPPAP